MAGSARSVIAIVVGVGVVVGSLATAGCKAAPRQRVLKTEPIAEGPGTLESERRRLEGTWELVKLETYDAAGSPQTLDATGRMTFDAFGNVRTTGTAKQGSQPPPSCSAIPARWSSIPRRRNGGSSTWRRIPAARRCRPRWVPTSCGSTSSSTTC